MPHRVWTTAKQVEILRIEHKEHRWNVGGIISQSGEEAREEEEKTTHRRRTVG